MAVTVLQLGFGPVWLQTDGNTDDSPKDRLDMYDGEFLFLLGRFVAVSLLVSLPLSRLREPVFWFS